MSSVAQMVPAGTSIDRGVLPTQEVVARVHRIQEVMKALMIDGTHFGKIPGTPKPTLYKPGAELLLMTFRIAASPSNIEDLSTPDEVRYRITVRGTNQVTGEIVGEMVGECSSSEEKYKWRKPVCDEEWQECDLGHRREKWQRGDNGAFKVKQVRTAPADVANTILKMATKRALIATTLVCLGASDIFAQDLEDLSQELRESVTGADAPKDAKKEPQRKSQATSKTSRPVTGQGEALTATGILEKLWRPKDKKYFAAKLKSDERLFTQWIEKHEQLEQDLKQFVDTDRAIKLAYTETQKDGKTYYNIIAVSIADAEPKVPAGDSVSAGDIFGNREPGAEG